MTLQLIRLGRIFAWFHGAESKKNTASGLSLAVVDGHLHSLTRPKQALVSSTCSVARNLDDM